MTASGFLHIKGGAGSGYSLEMKKTERKTSPPIAAAIRILQPVTLLLDGERSLELSGMLGVYLNDKWLCVATHTSAIKK